MLQEVLRTTCLIMTVQILLFIYIVSYRNTRMYYAVCRKVAREVTSYVATLAPMAFFIYILYVISFKL